MNSFIFLEYVYKKEGICFSGHLRYLPVMEVV